MGRKFSSTNRFSPHDSNTICDITGFKVKRSEVQLRWEGFYVIPDAWHTRQPQDFPVVPEPQHTYDDVRIENLDTDDPESFTPI
ncbi:MAG: hypothetical protein KAJ19_18450 [Gammaproteobacteria bacterium]|nr:hypothetical protein [Gammaproteobacteria bacterium]